MLNFTVYVRNGVEAEVHSTVEVDPADVDSLNEIKEMHKKATYVVSPHDGDSALALMNSRRGRSAASWSPELVTLVHELALEGITQTSIKFKVYEQTNEMVTDDAVRKTLRQEANADVEINPSLRAKVAKMLPAKGERGTRKKLTPEVEAHIEELYQQEMSGKAIAEAVGLSDSYVNAYLKKRFGPRQ